MLITAVASSSLFVSADGIARTWTIEADGSGDAQTIQAALDAASPGDTVDVGPGTYTDGVMLYVNIVVIGRFGPESTVLDGGGTRTPVEMGTGILQGFSIRNGLGGIRVDQQNGFPRPVIQDNIIEDNFNGYASDCCAGGGIENNAHGTIIVRNVIRNNVVLGVGGGIYSMGNDTHISQNVIAFNVAEIGIGGVGARGTITHNLIVGNHGMNFVGGAEVAGGEFAENTVYGNTTANGLGNAVGVRAGGGTVRANIIVNNRSRGNGYGLVIELPAFTTLECNDIWGNDIDAVFGASDPTSFSLDPLFCDSDPLSSLQFGLRSDSPCAPYKDPSGICAMIGGVPVTCTRVAVQRRSWGEIKLKYR